LITSSLTESKEMKVRRVTKEILFQFGNKEETRDSENLRTGTLPRQKREELQDK
jgi:hypothetical protein